MINSSPVPPHALQLQFFSGGSIDKLGAPRASHQAR